MARQTYGAVVSGCSGKETWWCKHRSTADRIRRVTRAYRTTGGWSGAATIRALADLAAAMPNARTSAILAEFARRGNALRRAEEVA